MLPIVSKPVKTRATYHNGVPTQCIFFDRTDQSYKQKAPYNLPSIYDRYVGGCYPGGDNDLGSPRVWADAISKYYINSRYIESVRNASYERLRGKIYDTAGLGVDAVEYRQSLDMIAKTCGTLLKATRAVKSLRFGDAAQALRMKIIPPGVKLRRAWGNNWLEYHFGWEPLIHDIYDAAEVINNPIKTFSSARGKASDYDSFGYSENLGSVTRSGMVKVAYAAQQGATVRSIPNGTLHTLEQLGLTNPLSLVWEVVPFSFVVDWFSGVGNVLRSVTDYQGMTLEKTYNSLFVRTMDNGRVVINAGFDSFGHDPRTYSSFGYWTLRDVGLSLPVFSVKPLRLPSAVRAITASALLSQFLRS